MKARLIDPGLSAPKKVHIKNVDQFYLDAPFHFHDACEIVLIEESFGKRVVGDHIAGFTRGDLVLMGPNLPHIWQNDSVFFLKKKDYRVKATVIYFSPSFLLELAHDTDSVKAVESLLHKANRGLHFKGHTNHEAQQKIRELATGEGLKKISIFLDLVDLLSRCDEFEYLASEGYKNAYTFKDTGRFNDVYQLLINNFHRTITLQEIASVANMSPTAFCRYFKNRTQKSLTRFIAELRISHALKLLQNKDYAISDVCYECGYNNPVHFNKSFKTIIGCTPSDYKKGLVSEP